MTTRILRFLTGLPRPAARALGIAAVVAVAFIDTLLPSRYIVVPLTVLPVGYVSWYDSRRSGVFLSFFAAVLMVLQNIFLRQAANTAAELLNGVLLLGVLLIVAVALDFIHSAYLGSLRTAESKYTHIVEAAIEGIIATDAHWQITFVNRRAAKLFDASMDALRGRILLDLVSEERARSALRAGATDDRAGGGPIETEFVRQTGGNFWALVTFTPTRALDGHQEGMVLLLTDISELKRSEQELNNRYREIQAMQRLASGLSLSLDLTTRLENAVDTVLDLTGFEAGCIYLLNESESDLTLHFHRGLLSREFAARAARWPLDQGVTGQVARTGIPTFIEDVDIQPFFDKKMAVLDGVRGFASIPLMCKEKVLGVLNIHRRAPYVFSPAEQVMMQTLGKQIGISLENLHLYEMARQRERQIRQLSMDLVQVQEEERRRFARELHDGLSQLLTTLKINSELALKLSGQDQAGALKHLGEVIALAGEAQTEAKQIAYDLRPAILDDFGLRAAIEVHANSFERRTGVAIDLHLPPEDVRFGSFIETTIYRIVQELLTNVAKHAGATRVTIQTLVRNNVLALTVQDNGRGFDVKRSLSAPTRQAHHGLRNIRERVEFFGGGFRVESVPGGGTEVLIELPLDQKAAMATRKEETL